MEEDNQSNDNPENDYQPSPPPPSTMAGPDESGPETSEPTTSLDQSKLFDTKESKHGARLHPEKAGDTTGTTQATYTPTALPRDEIIALYLEALQWQRDHYKS